MKTLIVCTFMLFFPLVIAAQPPKTIAFLEETHVKGGTPAVWGAKSY